MFFVEAATRFGGRGFCRCVHVSLVCRVVLWGFLSSCEVAVMCSGKSWCSAKGRSDRVFARGSRGARYVGEAG